MDEKLEQAATYYTQSEVKGMIDHDIDTGDMKRAFIAGANWQKEQSPWISVKDILPDNQDLVLVRSEYNGKATAYYHGKNSGFITYGEGAYKDFGDITHWMPIPE